MKYVTIVIVLIVIGGLLIHYKGSVQTYTAPEVVEKNVTVEVDVLDQEVNKAQEARKNEIEQIAQKAHDEAYNQEMKKVELEVVKSFNQKLNARQTQLEKDKIGRAHV